MSDISISEAVKSLKLVNSIKDNRIYCHFCNVDMTDDKSDKQFWFNVDDIQRHYCGKCGKAYGQSIFDEVFKRINRLKKEDKYYDTYKEIKLVETLHKNRIGNFKICFDNNYNYDKDLIKAPILKDGKPIGVITDVTPEKVEGFIWERYMPIVAELNHDQKPMSFEIVY